jgi:hypothetical protein
MSRGRRKYNTLIQFMVEDSMYDRLYQDSVIKKMSFPEYMRWICSNSFIKEESEKPLFDIKFNADDFDREGE